MYILMCPVYTFSCEQCALCKGVLWVSCECRVYSVYTCPACEYRVYIHTLYTCVIWVSYNTCMVHLHNDYNVSVHQSRQLEVGLETLRPLVYSSLAALGSLQPRALRSLNPVDPLVSLSNYYLLVTKEGTTCPQTCQIRQPRRSRRLRCLTNLDYSRSSLFLNTIPTYLLSVAETLLTTGKLVFLPVSTRLGSINNAHLINLVWQQALQITQSTQNPIVHKTGTKQCPTALRRPSS